MKYTKKICTAVLLLAFLFTPALEAEALAGAIGEFLKTQSEKARNAFVCRYFFMDPVKTVARNLGLTESNTKVLLHRTRIALREYLEKEGYL